MANLLEIKNLSYKKNQKKILQDVNLTLQSGKIVALLGKNGAGKTTLMRIIAGIAKNYTGIVTVSDFSDLTQRKAHLSFSDRLSGFRESSKIKQLGEFYQELYADFDNKQFEQLVKFMKLDPDLRLAQMSKGMREKLIIALSFSRKTDLYLLDEPFSGIDAMARKKIIKSIILWKDEKSTMLISDHFVNEIASILDEVVVIKDKTIYAHKSTEKIRESNESIEDFYENIYEDEED
ncbi:MULTISPECIES: ATP-binding cassette domain-containing protein [unclassified Lactobacillus]|uniref:ABC transporter ATP-binding protein n=1 Tax=unclassified Lactobacillus TaxID=2620435 RepID=UPI002269812E|nr:MULTISPECIES: ABC transporter ATP-binding protein [unclassified Lactobacillus]MCX8721060.1 ABC transporter ATP-binding protein [Lactobacillus sp. B4010]MCX8722836.1 ABC transporter ATP-binding protein [Lactobacillus sp. B4005]MCX8732111.1 ABC transporter ATP-binding protein [Lactobacillus sp. B4015]MCX8734202.1 ABC transporter ATP-binding protein [Lactobacillus sp. B4012]